MKEDRAPDDTDKSDRTVGKGGARSGGAFMRIALSVVLIVAMIGGASWIAVWLSKTKPHAQRRNVASLSPLVEVQVLSRQDVQEVFTGYGNARADQAVVLSAEVSGRIVDVPKGVKDGSRVVEDQVLARIDDRQYRQQLARAEGQLADADAQLKELDVEKANADKLVAIAREEVEVTRNEYKRLTDLYEKQVASKKEWDFARLAYQQSRRALQGLENQVELIAPRRARLLAARDARRAEQDLADLDVQRCTIKAPFTGQIREIMVEVGDRVQIGGPVLGLIDPVHIEVPIELPASVYPRTQVGSACELTVDSLPGVRWEATVNRLSPLADARSRTFMAYVEVDNAVQETPLVPGYFLTAKVSGPLLRQVFAVPRGAIVDGQVFVANDNKAHTRGVRTDRLIGDRAVVSGDLSAGDMVILTNLDTLYEGAQVRLRTMDLSEKPTTESRTEEAESRNGPVGRLGRCGSPPNGKPSGGQLARSGIRYSPLAIRYSPFKHLQV
ncbi:MAG: efflux RND transporter periplasmic adaptor subunit [Phycisphaerae bacterium]|nr:efflux RND transporter periplasmic adaptor subunit [Phycisphaerae bacterium]